MAANPCRIKGASARGPAERPVLSIPEVLALAAEVPQRCNEALVHLLVWSGVRIGEAPALQRRDLDVTPGYGSLSVRERVFPLKGCTTSIPRRVGRAFVPSPFRPCWRSSRRRTWVGSPGRVNAALCSRPRTAATSVRPTTRCCIAP